MKWPHYFKILVAVYNVSNNKMKQKETVTKMVQVTYVSENFTTNTHSIYKLCAQSTVQSICSTKQVFKESQRAVSQEVFFYFYFLFFIYLFIYFFLFFFLLFFFFSFFLSFFFFFFSFFLSFFGPLGRACNWQTSIHIRVHTTTPIAIWNDNEKRKTQCSKDWANQTYHLNCFKKWKVCNIVSIIWNLFAVKYAL